jgi:hypothetical protein
MAWRIFGPVPIVRFVGIVTPRELSFSLSVAGITLTQGDVQARLSLQIKSGDIDAICDINRFDPTHDWIILYGRVLEITRAAVDLLAFSKGAGLTVVFQNIILEDGVSFPPVFLNPNLASACTSFKGGESHESFGQVLGIVMNERSLFMALNDLVASLTVPEHAVLGCYRSVERLRHIIGPSLPRDRQLIDAGAKVMAVCELRPMLEPKAACDWPWTKLGVATLDT